MTEYYMSPRWSGEVADCSMPMTFDQYSNCAFQCVYCFSYYQRAINLGAKNYLQHKIKAVNVAKTQRIFTEPESSQFGDYVRDRKTMQWGGLSDPFCYYEIEYGVGLQLLRFFREIDYPICFSTKGTWWLDRPEYTELFKDNPNWNVKVTIITLDTKAAKLIERGAPSPRERLDAIEKIAKLNCGGATLRFRPFMFGISNPRHKELILEAGKRGATAVSMEFFCLERRSRGLPQRLQIVSDLAGFDYYEFYRKYSVSSGYLRLNRNVKRPYVDDMEEATHQAGMRFYVSDAHFKERCENGSCCGLPASWNYSRGQFCEALVLAKRNGRVTWPEIAKGLGHLENVPFERATGFNANSLQRRARFTGFTMARYMRWLWNNPKAGQSPYTLFEGVLRPVAQDADGDLIYEIDAQRT